MRLRNILRIGLTLFLISPFLFLFSQFQITSWPDWTEFFWAFKNSLVQAFFSAMVSLVIGLWVALGLVTVSSSRLARLRTPLEIFCLLPNFLPPIFILLSALNVIDPFPMGLVGIVIVHSLMNFGFVAVLIAGTIESKLGGMAELAYVEGAGRWQFLSRVLVPLLRKDLLLLGLFIFVVCFGSFAVPLIVGGGRGTTVEVLIYERIRLSSNWGDAVILAFLQSIFIFALSFVASQGRVMMQRRRINLGLLHFPSGILALLGMSSIYLFGYAQGFINGLAQMSTFYELQSALLWNFFGTLVIGLSVGTLCYGGLMLIAYCWPKPWFERFLNGYVAPSTSLACFCLLLVGPNEGLYAFIKISLALTLLSLNGLFRMGWDTELRSLRNQATVAYSMGASSEQIFKEILFPQLAHRAGVLAGIASIWACGDFAVSRILAHRDLSIAMMTETLMSGYRLNQAVVLSGLIIVAGLICFFVFVGGSRVLGRKFTP